MPPQAQVVVVVEMTVVTTPMEMMIPIAERARMRVSPLKPPLCPEALRDLQDRRNPDPLIRLRIPSVLTQM
jgi:hypothetical protein